MKPIFLLFTAIVSDGSDNMIGPDQFAVKYFNTFCQFMCNRKHCWL